MNKRELLYSAPVFNRSGYGKLADDVFHALNNNDHFNITVYPQPWGDCVRRTCATAKDKEMADRLAKEAPKQLADILISTT